MEQQMLSVYLKHLVDSALSTAEADPQRILKEAEQFVGRELADEAEEYPDR